MSIFPLPDIDADPGRKTRWSGIAGSACSLAIAETAASFDGLTLVITENTQMADRLLTELEFFSTDTLKSHLLEFPDWETLPYDTFSPHQDIVSRRLETLYRLPDVNHGIAVVPSTTLLHRLPPLAYVRGNTFSLKTGQTLNISDMRVTLEQAGYNRVECVFEHGEFAVRGSIMDLFPMGASQPIRIELFDDEIESLRFFDPESQISGNKTGEIRLLPGKEFPLTEAGISHFRQQFRARFDIDVRKCPVYEDVSQGFSAPGIEYYLPLFFEQQASLFDYLPSRVRLCFVGEIQQGVAAFWREIRSRYEDRCVDPQRPILPPSDLFLQEDELFSSVKHYPQLMIESRGNEKESHTHPFETTAFPELGIDHRHEKPLTQFKCFLAAHTEDRILICADSAGRREAVTDVLATADIRPESCHNWHEFLTTDVSLAITVAPLDTGFFLAEQGLIVIAESQLFTGHVAQSRRRRRNEDSTDFIIKSLTELNIGAPVVHIDHGIGRYCGLENFDMDGQVNEFLILEYADKAKLYIPVSSLHLISRYAGQDPENAPLHKLGSDQWEKAKRRAQEKIVDVAAELLDIYAQREARKGRTFNNPGQDLITFASSFPFEETEDQTDTIAAVIADMSRPQPMDRLVCGDVGFGKTEVAMRAAFIAVHNNSQVAVLVPTTLLAQQHYDTFRDRFADWPVRVELMSRFVSNDRQKQNLEAIRSGKIDIVIGTHKLLQDNIKYHDLGLLVIDEEHRFGVRQKEKIKAMRAEVDILTLTATPIPRTLNMSMSGVRDLSIIATPPARRLSVKTFVRQHSAALVKEAISRELLRGGQVFYLHNDVSTIERCAEELRELMPDARVAVGHGQLREKVLEKVMSDFYHKRFNVLVCSTIIETGIDIPSANTIIIDRADKFGLAQLHQLRGRVGRSHHQAYAYLLTPHPKSISSDASKRLDAITSADTLGAGFTLASHDLEIRGAGEFLGDEQSGHMQMIGFTLYSEMLEQTVKMMREGKQPDIDTALRSGTEVNLRIPALIPDFYLPDVHTRLLMYKRISNARDENELRDVRVEMIDRFGLLPDNTRLLFDVTQLRLVAESLGIEKTEANATTGKLQFSNDTRVDPYAIVSLVQESPAIFRLQGATELRFTHNCSQAEERLEFIRELLDRLKPGSENKSQ